MFLSFIAHLFIYFYQALVLIFNDENENKINFKIFLYAFYLVNVFLYSNHLI